MFVVVLGLSAGCSVVVHGLTDRCDNDADCTSRGVGYENATCVQGLCRGNTPVTPPPDNTPWGCLPTLAPVAATVPNATISFRFVDPVSEGPVPGVEVRSCGGIDALCTMPLAPPAVSDAEGRSQLPFSTTNSSGGLSGYTGYFYLTGSDRMPHLYFVQPPMVADREASFRVVTQQEIEAFAAIAGLTLEPDRSLLIVQSRDCQNVPTARSTFAVIGADDKTKLLYLNGNLPSTTATETDTSGTGFIVNTEPGIVTVEIVNLDAGRRVARTSVTVRRDHVTYAEIAPIPD